MNNDLIAEGRRLLDGATPGPWVVKIDTYGSDCGEYVGAYIPNVAESHEDAPLVPTDAELIVWARNNLPALLNSLERSEAALTERDERLTNLEQGREIERHALRNALAILARVGDEADDLANSDDGKHSYEFGLSEAGKRILAALGGAE